jgi:hypothetical protein
MDYFLENILEFGLSRDSWHYIPFSASDLVLFA